MRSSFADEEASTVVSVYQNVSEIVFDDKVKKFFRWRSVRPAILFTVCDVQASVFCGLFESLVVICVAATAILNAVNVVVIVNHFVKQSGNYVFDRS